MRVARPHPRARAGAEDGDGLPAARALPHRRDARHVHARRLHDRRRRDHLAGVPARRRRRRRASAAASTSPPRSRPTSPLGDAGAAVRRELPVDLRRRRQRDRAVGQDGARPATASSSTYPLRGFDDSFLNTTTYGLAARAKGYGSPRAVWQALSRRPDLAVVDALAAPRRVNWNFGVAARAAPARLLHRGRRLRPGRASSSATRAPAHQDADGDRRAGRHASRSRWPACGPRTRPRRRSSARAPCRPSTTCASRPASTPTRAARRLERAFLENGMEAKSVRSALHEALGASYT